MAQVNPYFEDIQRGLRQYDFTSLDGSRILITGATGLIGGCLVDILMHDDSQCHVYALGRNETRARHRFADYWQHERFHFVKGDVTEPLPVDVAFDYIIHAASNASPNFFKEKPVEVVKANITGVERLMEYGLAHQMRRMLFVSSGEIYGERQNHDLASTGGERLAGAFRETDSGYIDCATPRACYPSSKRAAETLCVSYAAEYGADVVIARPCHTYGPYFTESDNRVYAQFIRNVLNGEDIVMTGTGELYRSWIYVVDCALAILLLLVKGECTQAYNVADKESCVTIRTLAELTAQLAGRRVVMKVQGKPGNAPITCATFRTDKLEALGWQPLWHLAVGLQHTIDTLR
jgi:nucleoside-diphosphate-sugar epimerase